MTPEKAMKVFREVRAAWHTPKTEMLNPDGSYSIGNAEAAASVILAAVEAETLALRERLAAVQAWVDDRSIEYEGRVVSARSPTREGWEQVRAILTVTKENKE